MDPDPDDQADEQLDLTVLLAELEDGGSDLVADAGLEPAPGAHACRPRGPAA